MRLLPLMIMLVFNTFFLTWVKGMFLNLFYVRRAPFVHYFDVIILCLKVLQAENTLVIQKLDRLGRDLKHLVSWVDTLNQRQVGLKVLAGAGAQINAITANGRLVFAIFAALAEFEVLALGLGLLQVQNTSSSTSPTSQNDSSPFIDVFLNTVNIPLVVITDQRLQRSHPAVITFDVVGLQYGE
ncbi:MAG: recombinase family protein [Spirulina sp. SIO3F2]|nr:recombinase family protein [Spirulina sp. SIO3F2]